MPFTFKLSRRLARLKSTVLLAAGTSVLACEMEPAGIVQPGASTVRVVISPPVVALQTNQTSDLMAVTLTERGDTAAVGVRWRASGGTIMDTSSTGGLHRARYQSPTQPGDYQVIAASTSGAAADTSVVTVATPAVASVSLSPAVVSVLVGASLQLTATPQDASGNPLSGRAISWSSSAPGVASVNGSGLLTGIATGSATITATSEGQNGSASVTVSSVPVASVAVSPAAASLVVGATQQLSAVASDSIGNTLIGRAVTWASNNTAVASVNGSGLVTGRAAGSATISATSEGKTGTAGITVTYVSVGSVAISPASATVVVGATQQLSAVTKDSVGNTLTGRLVTWASSNTTVASVSGSGLVTGRVAGSATISATSEGKTGSASITVTNVPVASVTVAPASASVAVGATVQLAATPRDASGNPLTGRVVTWSSSSSTVATVSGTGLVSGITTGSATISATTDGVSGTAALTVTASPPPPPPPTGALPVFPGAEGYGTTTTAGRGGQVIRVTNLNDAGPGSLRAALSTKGPRTIIFDVSGQITLQSSLCIGPNGGSCDQDATGEYGHVTIAGQTAPSPGITLRVDGPDATSNLGLYIRTNDVLVQHIRIRAARAPARRECTEINGARIVLDHVSTAWGGSGSGVNMGLGGAAQDVTIRDFINAEGNGQGMLIKENGARLSVIRGIWAHNSDRNPETKGGVRDTWINNLIYNPGYVGRTPFGIWANPSNEPAQEGANLINYIGNMAKVGPTSDPDLTIMFSETVSGSQIYMKDNILMSPPIWNNGASMQQVGSPPFALPTPLTILPSGQVEAYVLAHAGARPADRDAVDARIVSDVINRTKNSQKGSFPTLAQNTRVLVIPADHATRRPSGYTALEEDVLFPLARLVEGIP